MAKVKGQNLRLFINNKVVAMATSCSLQIQSVIREVSNKDVEGGWAENRVVALNWSVQSDCVICDESSYGVTVADLENMVGSAMQVDLSLASGEHNAVRGDMMVTGFAILSDVNLTAQNRQRGTCSIQMTGQGRIFIPRFLADKNSIIFKSSDGYVFAV